MNGLWKNKYEVSWCELCGMASVSCPECHATSCNGTSCAACHDDLMEFFDSVNCCAEDYCSEQEINAYNKVRRIQSLIVSSIQMGDDKINWDIMEEQGKLCENDRKIFNLKINL
jgi:hypothetical protein